MVEPVENGSWASTRLGRHAAWLCDQPAFEASDRLKQLLLFLVQRSIEAPAAKVSQVEIAMEVLGCDASFDPSVDAHVRIEVGRLRKALELFYARCPNASAARIEVPKGSYRAELRHVPRATAIVHRAAGHETPRVALADFRSNDPLAAELAFLIGEEAQLRCQQAPLVRAGAMAMARLPADSEGGCLEVARRQGARLVMCGSVHHLEGRLRAYFTLIDVKAERVIARHSKDCSHGRLGGLRFADAIAEQIATELADPMLGAAPCALATADGRSRLDILMRAFSFMATQDVQRLAPAIDGLRWLQGDDRLLATSGALLADLHRVATNSHLTPDAASPGECVERAERALGRDPMNATAHLALGYAFLNEGRPERAVAIAANFPSEPGIKSLISDRRLLEAVAAANTPADAGTGPMGDNAEAKPIGSFFMDEIAAVIPLIASGAYAKAMDQLDSSANQGIFWLQLFKVAALTGMSEMARARSARQRLCALLPNAACILRPAVTGFFPNEAFRAPLLNSVGQAGLRLH